MKWAVTTGPELTTTELYEILKLRLEIFAVEQNCPYQDLDDQDLQPTIYHVRAISDSNELLAYNKVIYNANDKTQARIGRVVVKESARSTGIGRELMNRALELIKTNQDKHPCKTAMLHGQAYLRKWYESFGFEVEGGQLSEGIIPQYLMIKQL